MVELYSLLPNTITIINWQWKFLCSLSRARRSTRQWMWMELRTSWQLALLRMFPTLSLLPLLVWYLRANTFTVRNINQSNFDKVESEWLSLSSSIDGDETLPYAKTIIDPYIETKIDAEKIVLEYNGKPLEGEPVNDSDPSELRTVALRPSGIFGPRDAQVS